MRKAIMRMLTALLRYIRGVAEARRHSQRLEVALNASGDALFITDRTGVIRVANRQVGTLLGIQPERLLGCQEQEMREQTRLRGLPAVTDVTDVSALKEAERNLRQLYDSTITALTAAIDARDSYTHGHSARVSAYAVTIARRMGLPAGDLERIGYSGLLHDIGKLGIDDVILRKTGVLNPSERAIMMQHPVIGAAVLEKSGALKDLIPGVRWHHEWVAGGGYPDGLRGDEIPLDARIIGAADAFDAMTTARPYRPALTLEDAMGRIRAAVGSQFDPTVAAALEEAVATGEIRVAPTPHLAVAVNQEPVTGMIRPVHGKELSILYRLSRVDYASLSLDELLLRHLETFHDVIGPNVYRVYLYPTGPGDLALRATYGQPAAGWDSEQDLVLVRTALSEGSARVAGYHHLAVVPLQAEQGILGALVVEAPVPNLFERDDLFLLEAVAERLSSSVSLMRYHEKLAFAAAHDGLTGVFNHSHFYDQLTTEVSRAARDGHSVAVLLYDLNGLKGLNDTFGHQAGDAVLRYYGTKLQELVGESGMVARYGGDEFAVILPVSTRLEAERAASRMAAELAQPFRLDGGSKMTPVAAWGAAAFPEDASRAAELVYVADKRMYQHKRKLKSQTAAQCAAN